MAALGAEEVLDILSGALQLLRIRSEAFRRRHRVEPSVRNESRGRSSLKFNINTKLIHNQRNSAHKHTHTESCTYAKRERGGQETCARDSWEVRGEDRRHLREEAEEEDEEESEAAALAAAEGRRRAEAAAVAQPKAAAEAMRVGGVGDCDCGRSVFVSDRPRSPIWINLIRFAASPFVMDWILPDYPVPLGPCNSSLSPSPSRCHLSIYIYFFGKNHLSIFFW